MRIQKDNKAVSPVIGIMLMLVVTVILAAAVSSSSSGLMKSTEKAPFAVFDVKIVKDGPNEMGGPGNTSFFNIKHITGDAINTKDLKIVTTNAKGQIRNKVPKDVEYRYNNDTYNSNGSVPYWNNMGIADGAAKGWPGAGKYVGYGNFTLKPGVSMTAQQFSYVGTAGGAKVENIYPSYNESTGDYDATPIGQMQDMIADWNNVKKGDFINVKLIHMPSNKVIFSSDVEVI